MPQSAAVGSRVPHESAVQHVTGTARFTDDLHSRHTDVLHAWPIQVFVVHAKVDAIDTTAALEVPGVVRVLTAADVPGVNDAGTKGDEPLFNDHVRYYGHSVAWVLGDSVEAARRGAEAVKVDYTELPAILNAKQAIAAQSFQGFQPVMARGDLSDGFDQADHVFSGEFEFGEQEHFYLETHAALAMVDESGQLFIQSSTQHPSETQEIVAHVLELSSSQVTVQCLRMGGGFGGKEWQPHGLAAVAALGATLTGRPVRVRLNRTQDMTMTGKRHGFHSTWKVGFSNDGRITALDTTLTADGGFCLDLSEPVLSRALCHVDNAYWVPNIRVAGRIAKTNKTSQTAFRGFGGPQGMIVLEDILGRVAPQLGLTPEELRQRNFYVPGQRTPYGQVVEQSERMPQIWDQLMTSSEFGARRAEIDAFNQGSEHVKRGLAITPVKFGISFNLTAFNQGGALVLIYKDGSVLINHGGTEMGQGLHTKMLQVAATALGLPYDRVRLAPTRTDKVPNTSATAASTGSDLNGAAVKNACEILLARIAPVAAGLLGVAADDIRFADGKVSGLGSDKSVSWEEVIKAAYFQRISLSSTGFYRADGLHWDLAKFEGSPFKYFVYSAAVSEVEVSGFTGAYTTRRVDILHDAGNSMSPLIDIGQIEGGFVQGAGWLTLEEIVWDSSDKESKGRLATQGASTYKLPSFSEMPADFRVKLFEHATEPGVVYGSKAVGEPPLMLAFSVREALRDAAGAFGDLAKSVILKSPATPEAVFWAIERARTNTPAEIG
ncbi:xanthine dehydrogenase molybdopterin binding subunit [Ornithinimicrobium sp. Arc0846-15]|nr:xanthine dehydrogenase molybdopterin binding subunit [Ornithinimicrobium laminariae]